MNTIIKELKNKLEGKIITSVENGYGEACICRLIVKNLNSSLEECFQIHANDLGVWVKDINKHNNIIMLDSLGKMIIEIDEYGIKCDGSNFELSISDDFLKVKYLKTGDFFGCYLKHDWEKKVVKLDNFYDLFIEALMLGPFYKMVFKEKFPIPKDYN